jgi:excisionase family DNA binding protein
LDVGTAVFDAFIDQFVERIAEKVAASLAGPSTTDTPGGDEWLDSRHAADYLGVHRDTLRRLAAERVIASEQDGPGCKLYFLRSNLDAWRMSGGRPRHVASTLSSVG